MKFTKKKTNIPAARESPINVTPAKITPSFYVKVKGKDVTDLMSLKSFLARKKFERESKQAESMRVTTTAGGSPVLESRPWTAMQGPFPNRIQLSLGKIFKIHITIPIGASISFIH